MLVLKWLILRVTVAKLPILVKYLECIYLHINNNFSAGCPIGSYLAQTSPGNTVCRLCPNNSISVLPNSEVCECLQGYHRNPLEDIHVSCTSELLEVTELMCRYILCHAKENCDAYKDLSNQLLEGGECIGFT